MTPSGAGPVQPRDMSPQDELQSLRYYPNDLEGDPEGAREAARRAEGVMRAAQRDVSFRDFMTFALVRAWTAVLAIAAVFFALVGGKGRRHQRPDTSSGVAR